MAFRRARWSRMVFEEIPVYVQPEHPHWFVPNAAGDRLLERLRVDPSTPVSTSEAHFLARLPEVAEPARLYPGRKAFLSTDRLEELWLHVTDRCDLACRHCLFCCGPKKAREMPAERILQLAGQAHGLGARVFALTGGEPLIHRECHRVLRGLLDLPASSVVILTNGMSIRSHAEFLAQIPRERLHLQVSVDGLEANHDRLRGKGAFSRLRGQLDWLRREDWPFTVSTCIDRNNMHEMVDLVETVAEIGASALHLLWYFIRGRGKETEAPDTGRLADALIEASLRAEELGVHIDNLDAVRSRVFAPPGTKHDGPSSGWYSLAVAPDDKLYPSPALIGIDALSTGINGDLAASWRTSDVLSRLRSTSVAESSSPLRFLLGGGDCDHSYVHSGSFSGDDPYLPIYETIALWSIARLARRQGNDGPPKLRAMMGDLLETCNVEGEVALTHSNCVLSLTSENGTEAVGRFYAEVAEAAKEDILNPVCYDADMIAHIPPEGRVRGYGCGSPVLDAQLAPGESVVDLGSGMGVECFIAAKHVGSRGRVTGIDMLDPMLDRANRTADGVRESLGYDNVQFKKGLLEELPIEDSSADVVISNCVLNLSHDKRRVFSEIVRILRPGGRLVVSDVVCEADPGPTIRTDQTLIGECLGGALTQRDLFGLLNEAGLAGAEVISRFPYRKVGGHQFFSMTFRARKPAVHETLRVIYRGPFPALLAADGTLLPAGETVTLSTDLAERMSDQILILDDEGAISNLEVGASSCCTQTASGPGTSCCGPPETETVSCCETPAESASCCGPPEAETVSCCETPRTTQVSTDPSPAIPIGEVSSSPAPSRRERAGCMVCGLDLEYMVQEKELTCSYCGEQFRSPMVCPEGHFVCDTCHAADARAVIERVCLSSTEIDMVELFHRARSHPSVNMHGPEHHGLVPGVILAACRNAGASITGEQILKGIHRGSQIPGGSCGYLGICGGATGAGAAFSVLLEATPLKGTERRKVMSIVARILERISAFDAARCCQRDCYVALREAAEILPSVVRAAPQAEIRLRCNQFGRNADCVGMACPLHPRSGLLHPRSESLS